MSEQTTAPETPEAEAATPEPAPEKLDLESMDNAALADLTDDQLAALEAGEEVDGGTQAEEPADDAGGEEAEAEAAVEGDEQEDQPEAEAEGGEQPRIPKPRFDEVNEALKAEREARLKAEARLEMLQEQAKARPEQRQEKPEPQAPTIEQEIAHARQELEALASKWDDGDITGADFARQQMGINDRIIELRERQMMERVEARARSAEEKITKAQETQRLDALEAELRQQYPVMEKIGGEALAPFLHIASQQMVAEGKQPLTRETERETWSRALDLATTVYGGEAPAPDPAKSTHQAKPAAKKPADNKVTQLRAKLPPNLSQIPGDQGDEAGEVSEERIEGMSFEEIVRTLPASARG